MITVTETSTRTISTPEEIAAYLLDGYEQSVASTPFAPGELVTIARRDGITPEVGAGDVAIFLFSMRGSPWSEVLLVTSGGMRIVTVLPTGNLARRAAPMRVPADSAPAEEPASDTAQSA